MAVDISTIGITEGRDLRGKTAIVTGSSSGIGREVARVLALRGARVLMAVRNPKKAEGVVAEFVADIGQEAASRCVIVPCDTASMKSVREFLRFVASDGHKIDSLFLNAGVFASPFQITEDGFEYTCATNYIGHFLMVHSLATAKGFSPQARIIATISEGAYLNPYSRLDLETLTNPKAGKGRSSHRMASPNSKVLLTLMMGEFGRRVKGTDRAEVTFNSANPGTTKTDNVNQLGPVVGAIARVLEPLLFHDVTVGAAVLLWLATNDAVKGRTGLFFTHKFVETKLPPKCLDLDAAKRAWDATESILGLSPLVGSG